MLHKQIMDLITTGVEIFSFQNWTNIFYNCKVSLFPDSFLDFVTGFVISGVNNR